MRSLLACLIVSVASAQPSSQSLVMAAIIQSSGNFPNTAAFSSVGDWELSCAIENYTPQPGVIAEITGTGSGAGAGPFGRLEVDATGRVLFLGLNNSENVFASLSGMGSNFRFRLQRDTAAMQYHLAITSEEAAATVPFISSSGAIVTTGNQDYRLGSFNFGAPTGSANGSIIATYADCRWGTTLNSLTGLPSPRRITTSFSNLFDFEFEGSAADSSGNSVTFPTYISGIPTFAATTALNPVYSAVITSGGVTTAAPSITTPTYVGVVGSPVAFSAAASFANLDANTIATYLWAGGTGSFTGATTVAPAYTPNVFGQSTLSLTLTDALGNSTSAPLFLGATRLLSGGPGVDLVMEAVDTGVSSGDAAKMYDLIGPLTGVGQNQISWFDDRLIKVGAYNGSLIATYFTPYWNTPSVVGTISVVNGSGTMTGTGNLQTEFCSGGTSPVAGVEIYVWYPSATYPGQFGRGIYTITGCPATHTITVQLGAAPGQPMQQTYLHSANASGLSYTKVDGAAGPQGNWIYSSIPANYYDNCLGFYKAWFATGLTVFQTYAHSLCSSWWTSPNWDMGKDYDFITFGGTLIAAGPARGQSVMGLLIWGYETGTNVFPGVEQLWDYWISSSQFVRSQGNMGSIREDGYILNGLSICAQYDPSMTSRTNCDTELRGVGATEVDGLTRTTHNILESWDGNLKVTAAGGVPAHFVGTDFNSFIASSNLTTYVTTTNGSPTVTTTGTGFNMATLAAVLGNCNFPPCQLWFTNTTLPSGSTQDAKLSGNTSAGVGDTVVYKLSSVTNASTFVLTGNYMGTSGNHGLGSGDLAGFGDQIFQESILGVGYSRFCSYLNSIGDTVNAAIACGDVTSIAAYIVQIGIEPTLANTYLARGFLNCEPTPASDSSCTASSGIVQNGETFAILPLEYVQNHTPATKTAADALWNHMFNPNSPTSSLLGAGFTSPFSPLSTFLIDLADLDTTCIACGYGPYMMDPVLMAPANKWMGFFFGFTRISGWGAARTSAPATAVPSARRSSGKSRDGSSSR